MPTKRKLRAHHRVPEIDQDCWDMLRDHGEWRNGWLRFLRDAELRALWTKHGEAAVADYVSRHPGMRPFLWWRFSAPEPRARIGGKGVPKHDALGYAERYDYGLPAAGFVSAWEWRLYNGQARDVHGELMDDKWPPGSGKYKLGDFDYEPYDPNDPPVYESQATYLRRHELLLNGELRRLSEKDFKPEIITRNPLEPGEGEARTKQGICEFCD